MFVCLRFFSFGCVFLFLRSCFFLPTVVLLLFFEVVFFDLSVVFFSFCPVAFFNFRMRFFFCCLVCFRFGGSALLPALP